MTATRTLLLFGDSNTHGTMPMADLEESGRFSRDDRWAGRLARLLPEWEVINEGHRAAPRCMTTRSRVRTATG